jgi:hypothetical protein
MWTADRTKNHHDRTNPIRPADNADPGAPETYDRAAPSPKTNKKRCETNPKIRPGAIENAVFLPKTNPE